MEGSSVVRVSAFAAVVRAAETAYLLGKLDSRSSAQPAIKCSVGTVAEVPADTAS
jgi:hypothetical protein